MMMEMMEWGMGQDRALRLSGFVAADVKEKGNKSERSERRAKTAWATASSL